MKPIDEFKDVLFDCIGLTFSEQKLSKQTLIYKSFVRSENEYALTALFNLEGNFIAGFLYRGKKAELLTNNYRDFVNQIKVFKEKNYAKK